MHLKTAGLTALALAGTALAAAPVGAVTNAAPTCSYSHLTARIAGSEGAAGSTYVKLAFRNIGRRTCALRGHPGVSFVSGADGHQVGQPAVRAHDRNVVVKLAPGHKAYATLRIVNALNFPKSTCNPTPVRGLRVYPPGATKSFFLPLATTACASRSTMTVNAVRHG